VSEQTSFAVDRAWPVTDRDFSAPGSAAEALALAVRYANLAPSSHNTQPWLLRIDGGTVSVRPVEDVLLEP
jgi:hypothetical protein